MMELDRKDHALAQPSPFSLEALVRMQRNITAILLHIRKIDAHPLREISGVVSQRE